MNLKPIQKKRVYQEIIEQIQVLIKNGDLKPGDKLPSERELANSLSVSRSAVREAVSVLESAGLIEILPGIGIFLIEDKNNMILSRLSGTLNQQTLHLAELMDIRQGVEGQGAYLAAIFRTDEELETIREVFEGLKQSPAMRTEAVHEFHRAVAAAAKNTTLLRIVELLLEKFSKDHEVLHVTGEKQMLLMEYSNILDAIEGRDSEKAERAMKRHLVNVKSRMAGL